MHDKPEDIIEGSARKAGKTRAHDDNSKDQAGRTKQQAGRAGEDENNDEDNRDRTRGGDKNRSDDAQRKAHNTDPDKQSGNKGNR